MLKIVEATPQDATAIVAVLAEVIFATPYYSPPARMGEIAKYTPEFVNRNLTSGEYFGFVARDEKGQLVALVFGHRESPEVFFGNWIVVSPAYRRSGIASALLSELIEKLKAGGVSKMAVHTRLGNKESVSFLQKFGFQNTKTIAKNWYGEDSLVWEKIL